MMVVLVRGLGHQQAKLLNRTPTLAATVAAEAKIRFRGLCTVTVDGAGCAPPSAAQGLLVGARYCNRNYSPPCRVWLTYVMKPAAPALRLNGQAAAFRVLPGVLTRRDRRSYLTLRGDVGDDQLIITNDGELRVPALRWLGRNDFVMARAA
jgi:hypothetical protein